MHLATVFAHRHRCQPTTTAWPAHAFAVGGLVSGTVDAANDETLVTVQKFTGLPVQFHRHMQAAIQVGAHNPVMAQHKGTLGLAVVKHVPDMGCAAVAELQAGAQPHFGRHGCFSHSL